MAQTAVTIRMDSIDKKQLEYFCGGVGINMTTLFNMFVKRVLKDRRLPFAIENDEIPNRETLEAFEEAEDIIMHPENYKSYDSVDEMFSEALADEQ